MNNVFEKTMCAAIEVCHAAPVKDNFQDEAQKKRVILILSALCGYLTEDGTTYEQDLVLREIKVLPPKMGIPPPKIDILPPMTRHDDVGEIMTLGDWRQAVKDGAYTDDDGMGNLATETHVSDLEINPSDAEIMPIPAWVTHVVWYNR